MEKFPVNADTLNAMFNAMGALVFATVRQLPPTQQRAFADDLARMARAAEKRGATIEETMLIDLQNAAREAP